jgi:Domain of unknown function (DUF4136)
MDSLGNKASLRNILRSLAITSFLVVALANAQNTTTDYDHSTPFSQYHTYSWGQVSTSDPLNVQRVKDAVDHNLSAKGWQMAPSGGNVTITAVGATHNQQEYNSFYDGLGGFGWRRGWGGGGFGETTTTVEQIPIGTLVIDMYDGSSKQLVWRGMSTDTLSSKPEKNTQKLDKAIAKLFEKFPPKGGQ